MRPTCAARALVPSAACLAAGVAAPAAAPGARALPTSRGKPFGARRPPSARWALPGQPLPPLRAAQPTTATSASCAQPRGRWGGAAPWRAGIGQDGRRSRVVGRQRAMLPRSLAGGGRAVAAAARGQASTRGGLLGVFGSRDPGVTGEAQPPRRLLLFLPAPGARGGPLCGRAKPRAVREASERASSVGSISPAPAACEPLGEAAANKELMLLAGGAREISRGRAVSVFSALASHKAGKGAGTAGGGAAHETLGMTRQVPASHVAEENG